jgi:HEAT repeat protein
METAVMRTQPAPLTDDQMRGFVRDGFVVVKPGVPAELHREVWDRTDALFEDEGNPGNNLIARVPAIQRVFDDPSVTGALTGILGPNYFMHPHRHCHYRPPHSPGQTIHKDSFTKRRHRTRWVLGFYYPQTTTVDMGPTGVLPGSHYYNWLRGPIGVRRHVDGLDGEVPLEVDAGTVVLVHYDIWHRGMPNDSDKKRYMIKIMFTRIEEPAAPSWSNADPDGWGDAGGPLAGAWKSMWGWYRGAPNANGGATGRDAISRLAERLRLDDEAACLEAAYALAASGEAAVPTLVDVMRDEFDAVRLNASYALSAIGGPAAPALAELARDPNAEVRASAVETLADIGPAASSAIPSLVDALADESPEVRVHAADALGIAGQSSAASVGHLARALVDEDTQVRRNAALALARIGPCAEESVPSLAVALDDGDRYVRGKAAHALKRIGTPDALNALIGFLETARWCDLTTKDSLY